MITQRRIETGSCVPYAYLIPVSKPLIVYKDSYTFEELLRNAQTELSSSTKKVIDMIIEVSDPNEHHQTVSITFKSNKYTIAKEDKTVSMSFYISPEISPSHLQYIQEELIKSMLRSYHII